MAIAYSWGFTNNSDSSYTLTPKKVEPSYYAVTVDDPGKCIMKNTTSPIDQQEVITYQASDISIVQQTDKNLYPPKVVEGRVITVKLEEKLRLTSSTDDTFMVDLPVNCNVTFRFTKSQYITEALLKGLLARLVGALQNETDGSSRIGKMMRMQLNPNS